MKKFKKLYFFAFAAILCLGAVFGGTMLVTNVNAAEYNTPVTTVTNATLNFEAVSRAGTPITPVDTGDWSSSRYASYSWSEIEKVNLALTGDLTGIPEQDSYTYSLTVEYIQRYREQTTSFDAENADEVRPPRATVENVYTGTVENLNELPSMVYYFDCHQDDKNVENANDKTHKNYGNGWGIYRFTLNIGHEKVVSEFVIVRPVKPTATPAVTAKAVSSQSGIESAYTFTLNDEYKYADPYTIKWYVSGEAVDGTKYVLTTDDLALDGVTQGTKALYNVIDRFGTEFYLDFQKVSGTWNVSCEVYDITRTQVQATSEAVQVKSGNKVKQSVLIWCLIAGGVVLLAIIIFIIVKSVKKEKVW